MHERIVQFGPGGGLVGVLTEPAHSADGAPAVLLLNAGVLHRVGPFGWYAALARRLAGGGVPVLRFDLAGIGDSPLRADDRPEVERALADIGAAMDHLEQSRGVRRFVLVGLCSGAMFAHHAAIGDARVAGAAFLDGYGYRTLGFYRRHYLPRLGRARSWVGLLRRVAARLVPALAPPRHPRAPRAEGYFLDFPPRGQVRAELQALLQRGAALLFLYSGGLADQYFNDVQQFREMFGDLDPAGGQLAVEYHPRADHLYTDLDARAVMMDRIEALVQSQLPVVSCQLPVVREDRAVPCLL